MLMPVAVLAGEAAAPQGWIDLGNAGVSFRNVPAVEWPEMDAGTKALTDEPQPGKPGMSRFGHRSLHVEMKDRFRAARTFVGQSLPTGVPHAHRAVPHHAVANEINVDVFISRPIVLEIVKK